MSGPESVHATGIEFIACPSWEQLAEALKHKEVDTVITSAGLPIETRL